MYSVFQISSSLLNRVAGVDQNFFKEMDLIPRVSPEFELTLDTATVVHSIQTMNFFQMKGKLDNIYYYDSKIDLSIFISWAKGFLAHLSREAHNVDLKYTHALASISPSLKLYRLFTYQN